MKDMKAYIIRVDSWGDGLEGEWSPQEHYTSIACDQVFLKEESAHARARYLCMKDAMENNGKFEEVVDEDNRKRYVATYPKNSGFYDFSEYRIIEMQLCDIASEDEESP